MNMNGSMYPQMETDPILLQRVAVCGSNEAITTDNVCAKIAERMVKDSDVVFQPATDLQYPTAIVPCNSAEHRAQNPILNLKSLKQLIRYSVLRNVSDLSHSTEVKKWRVSLWLADGSTRLFEVGAENQLEAFIYAVLECAHDTQLVPQEVISIVNV